MQYYMAVAIYCAPLHTIYRAIYYARYRVQRYKKATYVRRYIFSSNNLYASRAAKLYLNTSFGIYTPSVSAYFATFLSPSYPFLR